jgi:2-polyprenyl-3-methyl-5-hydroxy-6-metoxy-1,4-benzoquinol methylase
MEYEYRPYWEKLHQRGGLSGVGQTSMSDEMNVWLYRTRRRNLRRFARTHHLDGGRLLEVGIGTGYWVPLWQELGYEVDGCDLVASAADAVQRAHPEGAFWQADLSSPDGIADPAGRMPDGGYDVVAAIDVLLHVTDDENFQRALGNLASMVRPGGHLLLGEPALIQTRDRPTYKPRQASRIRPLRSYRRPLRALGFRMVGTQAATVLAANPIEASSQWRLRMYQRWWRLVLSAGAHRGRTRIVGPLVYAADALLLRTGEAPTSKLVLFRRRRTSVPG